jgi:ethanolaminephosphotransferase
MLTIMQFCDHAQKLLNVPPNNPSFLHILVSIACLTALIILLFKGYSRAAPLDTGCWIFGTILVSNAVTIFINQLVVEEHHYWYWTSFVWLSYLGFKRYVTKVVASFVRLKLITIG